MSPAAQACSRWLLIWKSSASICSPSSESCTTVLRLSSGSGSRVTSPPFSKVLSKLAMEAVETLDNRASSFGLTCPTDLMVNSRRYPAKLMPMGRCTETSMSVVILFAARMRLKHNAMAGELRSGYSSMAAVSGQQFVIRGPYALHLLGIDSHPEGVPQRLQIRLRLQRSQFLQ